MIVQIFSIYSFTEYLLLEKSDFSFLFTAISLMSKIVPGTEKVLN